MKPRLKFPSGRLITRKMLNEAYGKKGKTFPSMRLAEDWLSRRGYSQQFPSLWCHGKHKAYLTRLKSPKGALITFESPH